MHRALHRGTSKSQDRQENHNGSDLQQYRLSRAVWSLFRKMLELNVAAQGKIPRPAQALDVSVVSVERSL